MGVFVDTSAFFALIDANDEYNKRAEIIFKNTLNSEEKFYTSNYVILETIYLLQRSFNLLAVNDFKKLMLPIINTIWIDERIHNECLSNMIAAQRKKVSLTDYCSFYILDNFNIGKIFTFDKHFKERNYNILE